MSVLTKKAKLNKAFIEIGLVSLKAQNTTYGEIFCKDCPFGVKTELVYGSYGCAAQRIADILKQDKGVQKLC